MHRSFRGRTLGDFYIMGGFCQPPKTTDAASLNQARFVYQDDPKSTVPNQWLEIFPPKRLPVLTNWVPRLNWTSQRRWCLKYIATRMQCQRIKGLKSGLLNSWHILYVTSIIMTSQLREHPTNSTRGTPRTICVSVGGSPSTHKLSSAGLELPP